MHGWGPADLVAIHHPVCPYLLSPLTRVPMYATWPKWTVLESTEAGGCRKDFVSGLWSIKPIRLHLADAGTNTSREESGYATSSNAHTPPSSASSPARSARQDDAQPSSSSFSPHGLASPYAPVSPPSPSSRLRSRFLPPESSLHSGSLEPPLEDLAPPTYAPPPPPPLSPSSSSRQSSPPPSERFAAVDETLAAFNSFFERSAELPGSSQLPPLYRSPSQPLAQSPGLPLLHSPSSQLPPSQTPQQVHSPSYRLRSSVSSLQLHSPPPPLHSPTRQVHSGREDSPDYAVPRPAPRAPSLKSLSSHISSSTAGGGGDRRQRSRSQPDVNGTLSPRRSSESGIPLREGLSVGSLYQRIDYLSGLLRHAEDAGTAAALEGELETLYAKLGPSSRVQSSARLATTSKPVTLRQKKLKNVHRERRRSRWDEEWEDEEYEHVVGVDIGTSFTRVAFAVRGDPELYPVHTEDNGERGSPSCLLLLPDGRFHSFGAGARRAYQDLEPAAARRYLYFENFKANIVLRGFQEPGLESCIQAASGRFVPALDVFAHLLRHIRHVALRAIARQKAAEEGELVPENGVRPPDPQKVKWVLVVPFFWSQEAKNFMREAAYHGSLGTANRSEQIRIALSPESAALWGLRHFSGDAAVTRPPGQGTLVRPRAGKAPHRHLVPGEALVVIDCGGGSVEGGVFQVSEDGAAVHQLLPALAPRVDLKYNTGGPRGDLAVDLGFEILLCELFGAAFIKEYQHRHPLTWLELLGAFSARKQSIRPDASGGASPGCVNLTLPASFATAYARHGKRSNLASAVRKHADPDIAYTEEGVLRLGGGCLQRLFQPTVAGIVAFVEEVLAAVPVTARPALRSLFLLGGFAQSPLLHQALHKTFGHRLQVVIPSEAPLASVLGAVMLGRSGLCVASRASHLSYGVGVLHPFDASVHPVGKRAEKAGAVWCVDVYDPLVRVGELLRRGHTVCRRYCPASPSQKEILLQLYSCESASPPAFVTDAGVQKSGQLRIRLHPPQTEDESREVEVRVVFGNTELTANVRQIATGASLPCHLSFR